MTINTRVGLNTIGPKCCAALGLALILSIGCNRTSLDIAPVHGKVTVDGKPLAKAKIRFAPIAKGNTDPGKPAWGEIQTDGTYRLTTYKTGDGAVVGEHWVTILNPDEELPAGVPDFSRLMVRNKALVATARDNEINFGLSSDEVKKSREDAR
jgi:hypothetical protein